MSEFKSFGTTKLSMGYVESSTRVTAHHDRVLLAIDGGAIGLSVHLSFDEATALSLTLMSAVRHGRSPVAVEPAREPESVS